MDSASFQSENTATECFNSYITLFASLAMMDRARVVKARPQPEQGTRATDKAKGQKRLTAEHPCAADHADEALHSRLEALEKGLHAVLATQTSTPEQKGRYKEKRREHRRYQAEAVQVCLSSGEESESDTERIRSTVQGVMGNGPRTPTESELEQQNGFWSSLKIGFTSVSGGIYNLLNPTDSTAFTRNT